MQVQLNVGGVLYMTTTATLSTTSCYFQALVEHNPNRHEFFVDRDPTHFRHILNWLRGVKWIPEDINTLSELEWEADFFCISDLLEAIRVKRRAALRAQ